MTEEKQSTSSFWRRLLEIEAPDVGDVLEKFLYPHRYARPLFYFLFGLFAKFYCRIKVGGLENIPATSPYIVAPNHQSALDYPSVAWAMGKDARRDLYVVATKFFYDNPFARFFMKIAANVERIDTVDDFLPALRVAVRILKSGKSLYINPEGTRSETGELLPFKPGVGVLACELNVPIIPVYVHGTLECLPPGSIFPRPGRIEVIFGKPISMDEYRAKLKDAENAYFVYKEVTEELRRRIKEIRDSILSP